MELLQYHRPTYWFSGHFHVKFSAVYRHPEPEPAQSQAVAAGGQDKPVEQVIPAQGTEGSKAEVSNTEGMCMCTGVWCGCMEVNFFFLICSQPNTCLWLGIKLVIIICTEVCLEC